MIIIAQNPGSVPAFKHQTDLERIDIQENEQKKSILGEDNVYTKQREIIQINI
jgi:hypothetical protein